MESLQRLCKQGMTVGKTQDESVVDTLSIIVDFHLIPLLHNFHSISDPPTTN